MCADCPSAGVEKDPESQVLTPGGMESKPHRGEGVCQRGCGLLLSGLDVSKGEHCCVEALRTVADALEERSVTLEHEARIARLRWNRREQCLLAQASTLQNQAQLDALKYQRRLNQYLVHIRSIAEQLAGYCKVRGAFSKAILCKKKKVIYQLRNTQHCGTFFVVKCVFVLFYLTESE